MSKKIRFPIRAKLAIMSTTSIAVAVTALGIFLSVSYSNSSYESAENALKSVTTNAELALENSLKSAETSMNLLTSQIGYNDDFANNITKLNSDDPAVREAANDKIIDALAGPSRSGDGSTIIGAINYLVITDSDIDAAGLYSPFVSTPIYNNLMPVSMSKVTYSDSKYNELISRPERALWFFQKDDKDVEHLYAWKAVVNYGVEDVDQMQVVGYLEYTFNYNYFLASVTDTKYQNEGMLLYDETGRNVLSVSCGVTGVDSQVLDDVNSLEYSLKRFNNRTVIKTNISPNNWTFVTYINHNAIEETNKNSRNLIIIVVSVSVVAAALVAYLLAAREIRRIRKLSKAAGEISEGNYDIRLDLVANDEITDVGQSFNVMAERVQDVLQELILQQDSISENFATILSNKSGESGNHVKRVSEYSAILAEEMGFNENEVHDIRIASMLHDVGKIMVDESILHKPGKFTDEEYKIMQQHVVYGGKLLQGVPGNIMQLGAIIALYHHERWDGNGYVNHLKGDEIPKEAQITSVADVFDALVSKRCYKGAWTIEEAYNEIVSQSGKQFAPLAVEAFIKRFNDFKRISEEYKDEE